MFTDTLLEIKDPVLRAKLEGKIEMLVAEAAAGELLREEIVSIEKDKVNSFSSTSRVLLKLILLSNVLDSFGIFRIITYDENP